ncbi:MAG: hypothetical protein [Ixodes ricinus noda-like-virus 1]|nr:MAG: hypothetical protein [Ixodes ricinus noda-like-virus 1]
MWRLEWPEHLGFWRLSTHRNCVHNEIRACRGRVIKETNPPDPECVKVLRMRAVQLAQLVAHQVRPIRGYMQLIELFPSTKRPGYRRALRNLLNCNLQPKDWMIKAFVKSEKLKIAERDGDPRMIQARSMSFNLEFGLYTRALEKALSHLEDPLAASIGINLPMIAKGKNLQERACILRQMWDVMDHPVALSLDLSRWDMHVGPELISVMHAFYLTLQDDSYFRFLLSKQLKNTAVTQNNLRYKNPAGVTSGDMTTALGNCVAVIAILETIRSILLASADEIEERISGRPARPTLKCYRLGAMAQTGTVSRSSESLFLKLNRMITSYLQENDRPRRILCERALPMLFFDDGDDHVFLVEKELAPLMKEVLPVWWSGVGHELKVEGETDEFHQILFCQHKPFPTEYGWVMSPDPAKVLATSTVLTGNNMKQPREYLKTVWTARALLHQGVPVMGPTFQCWSRKMWFVGQLSQERMARDVQGLYNLLKWNKLLYVRSGINNRITPEQRLVFYQQWGITPDQQKELEMCMPPSNPRPTIRRQLLKWGGRLREVEASISGSVTTSEKYSLMHSIKDILSAMLLVLMSISKRDLPARLELAA